MYKSIDDSLCLDLKKKKIYIYSKFKLPQELEYENGFPQV